MTIPEGSYAISGVLVEGSLRAPPEQATPSLEVEGRRIGGNGGCNRFTGEIDSDGRLGPLATTMMACSPPIMEFEQHLLGLLSRVDGNRVSGSNTYLVEDELDLVELTIVE